jgi:hypothetical protein
LKWSGPGSLVCVLMWHVYPPPLNPKISSICWNSHFLGAPLPTQNWFDRYTFIPSPRPFFLSFFIFYLACGVNLFVGGKVVIMLKIPGVLLVSYRLNNYVENSWGFIGFLSLEYSCCLAFLSIPSCSRSYRSAHWVIHSSQRCALRGTQHWHDSCTKLKWFNSPGAQGSSLKSPQHTLHEILTIWKSQCSGYLSSKNHQALSLVPTPRTQIRYWKKALYQWKRGNLTFFFTCLPHTTFRRTLH